MQTYTTSTHWGNFVVTVEDDHVKEVQPYAGDADPSPIGQSLLDAQDPNSRVARPMIRQGYLENGISSDRTQRGREPFVPVEWDQALDIVAAELTRVRQRFGNASIYAGSYGWGSAGTLHRSTDQMHRLLNLIGGFTGCQGSYSLAAGYAIMPRVVADMGRLGMETTSWQEIAEHAELVVLFGGAADKNAHVGFGGMGAHTAKANMRTAKAAGVDFVNISPIREDVLAEIGAGWLAPRPNSDTALMLALAHTLVTEDLYDQEFVARYCTGFDQFRPYLLGESDGQPKDAQWAAAITELPAETIVALARRMACCKTVVSVSWSIQRAEHGEQPFWMTVVLAALLGEIGLPGRGFALGLNCMHSYGSANRPLTGWPKVRLGANPTNSYIPVARIADMLLHPNEPYNFDGQELTYPNARLVYWTGGNPFHHHQDLNRLIKAWQQPETVIVHEPFWTATARYSDIVLPATVLLERNDINFTFMESTFTPMQQALPAYGQARSDFAIFTAVAERLGVADQFTEGRDEMGWLRHFYEDARNRAEHKGVSLPDFESFWLGGSIEVESTMPRKPNMLERFRQDPVAHALNTPSGKIEIFSKRIASFGYDDCPGHPTWLEPTEWLGSAQAQRYPLHLLSNQPKGKLHSQLDNGRTSRNGKVQTRQAARMNPAEAAARNIADGDFIRVFNKRGACLSVAALSDDLRPGVIELPTGAWYNPADPKVDGSLEIHGNPNVLTRDVGTSQLAQGPSAFSALVEVEKYEGELYPVTVFELPEIVDKSCS